jgi:enamine deaminase RidA (YjgF/YER057c/UK114 family)
MDQRVYSGSPWEEKVAYCRARRVGDLVFVAGTTATGDDGAVVGPGDLFRQCEFVLEKIARALAKCGASMADVVRTRTFVTDLSRFEEFARAHRAAFQGVDPVATCVEVKALVRPDLLVEIEVDAVVPPPAPVFTDQG